MMTPVQVVGVGLDGAAGLTESVQQIVAQATLLVGSDRHLSYFPHHPADRLPLGDLRYTLAAIRDYLTDAQQIQNSKFKIQNFDSRTGTINSDAINRVSIQHPIPNAQHPTPLIVILASGDPLFFGLGRLLLAELPAEWLTFHPHLSAVQLAFNRIKVPWQDARLISAHGRSLEELTTALQQGAEKIAVLTDGTNSPAAIAQLLRSLDLPAQYICWVCENLGGEDEQIQVINLEDLQHQEFAPLNVVVLLRSSEAAKTQLDIATLPALGIPDHYFLSFGDRPGLITKREVRLLALGELALQAGQTIWDVGAGTGSVSIEMARLCPDAKIYAIEKTAAGIHLIQQNSDRFQISTIHPIYGSAPDALQALPPPDRIFIGGSGGNLEQILDCCSQTLRNSGVIVMAIATVEHLGLIFSWLADQRIKQQHWHHRLLQVQLSRSVPIAALTRLTPLNPVTLITLIKV
jgi:precorrin-6B C5,15-methyltransferase / cobalt-precorrin-6B C5,C15-methyltransferase